MIERDINGVPYDEDCKRVPADNNFEEEALLVFPDPIQPLGDTLSTREDYYEDLAIAYHNRIGYIKGRQKTTSLEIDRVAGEAWDAAEKWNKWLDNDNEDNPGEKPPNKETYVYNLNKK
jgi:hypothetical protein